MNLITKKNNFNCKDLKIEYDEPLVKTLDEETLNHAKNLPEIYNSLKEEDVT